MYMRRSVFGFRNYVSSLPKVPVEAKNSPNREFELPEKYNFCRLLEFHWNSRNSNSQFLENFRTSETKYECQYIPGYPWILSIPEFHGIRNARISGIRNSGIWILEFGAPPRGPLRFRQFFAPVLFKTNLNKN